MALSLVLHGSGRPRIGSLSSESSSSASSSCSSPSHSDQWTPIDADAPPHSPRRNVSVDNFKPILRSFSTAKVAASPSMPALNAHFRASHSRSSVSHPPPSSLVFLRLHSTAFHCSPLQSTALPRPRCNQPKPKRISWSTQSLCLFSVEESPRQVSMEQYFAKPINSDKAHLFADPAPESEPDLIYTPPQSVLNNTPYSWSILSSTTPSPLHPAIETIKTSNIAFEFVRILNTSSSFSSLEPVKVAVMLLVRNLAFEKDISAVYTCNGWQSTLYAGNSATFMGHATEGVDRFQLALECPVATGSETPGTPDRILHVEFALKCTMAGIEHWDNRHGANHHFLLKGSRGGSPVSGSPSTSPRRIRSALDMETEEQQKRRASLLALKVGAAVANEARRIDDEFARERRRSLEEAATAAEALFAPFRAAPAFTLGPEGKEVQVLDYLSVASQGERVSELSEQEAAVASRMAALASSPLRRVGSNASLGEGVPTRPLSPRAGGGGAATPLAATPRPVRMAVLNSVSRLAHKFSFDDLQLGVDAAAAADSEDEPVIPAVYPHHQLYAGSPVMVGASGGFGSSSGF
ncbi:hypothetical protein BC830DRAFT_1175372 [Chytriomyces sp. MP71]|nr:hypothetical protein BC830DRAFT_1175372 [Chytriomyces sp. MP71]